MLADSLHMIERTDLVFLLISLFCVAIALGSNPLFPKCERDTDCPPEFSCKLVCNSSCNSLCVPLKKISRRPQQPLRSRESTELDAAPFAANANPFAGAQADESSTPLTISEKELEAEFNKSGSSQPEPPPKFIAGPESEGSTAWTFAPGELAAGSTEQQISPPSFSPQPRHLQSSFASSSESRELKEPPYTSSREKEAKETSKKRKGNAESFSRSLEILTITSTTSSPDNSQELEEETSTKTTPAKQAFKKAKAKPKAPKTKKPSKSTLIIKKTTTAPTSLADGCPAPPICGKNCVIIDEDGCQTCRCLWTSGLCSTDFDCSGEGLFCDLGRCECKSGYEHDKEPGICKSIVKDKPTQQGIRLISTAGGIISGKAGKNLPVSRRLKKIANIHQNRARRSLHLRTNQCAKKGCNGQDLVRAMKIVHPTYTVSNLTVGLFLRSRFAIYKAEELPDLKSSARLQWKGTLQECSPPILPRPTTLHWTLL
uniref:Uncharacterized protein n=1 Tax=Ditylenchus dipsaci TaxID=166011 RepID=A0A915DE59_9BILA